MSLRLANWTVHLPIRTITPTVSQSTTKATTVTMPAPALNNENPALDVSNTRGRIDGSRETDTNARKIDGRVSVGQVTGKGDKGENGETHPTHGSALTGSDTNNQVEEVGTTKQGEGQGLLEGR